MNLLLAFLLEILLMGIGESLSVKVTPDTLAKKHNAENVVLCCALAFVLGIASVYFMPMLALREPIWQWFNAFLSPLIVGVLIVLWRRKVRTSATKLPQQTERTVLFQAFAVGLVFNLSRLLFGH